MSPKHAYVTRCSAGTPVGPANSDASVDKSAAASEQTPWTVRTLLASSIGTSVHSTADTRSDAPPHSLKSLDNSFACFVHDTVAEGLPTIPK